MKNTIMKNLIKDVYEIVKDNKDISAFLYGQTYLRSKNKGQNLKSSYIHSMNVIDNINDYLSNTPVESLSIQSKQKIKEGFEPKIIVNEWSLEEYSLKNNCLTIVFKNEEIKKIIL